MKEEVLLEKRGQPKGLFFASAITSVTPPF